MEKNIVLAREFSPDQIESIRQIASHHQLQDQLDEQTEIILGWNEEILDQLEDKLPSSLKWIQSHTAGVDQFPLLQLSRGQVQLTNAKGIHKEVIAETVFGVLLAYQRQVLYACQHQTLAELRHSDSVKELGGKTAVIVGTGSIGQQIGRVAQLFNLHTIGVNRSGREADGMDELVLMDELDTVLNRADIIINILPLTAETHHLYDLNIFRQLKKDSLFINVGRGESVVEADLLQAIEEGYIEFAGLDVFQEEPLPADHPFWNHDQLLVLPHIAGSREDYLSHVVAIFRKNYESFIQEGQAKVNPVDLADGY